MHIKSMVLEGFKSYGKRVEINGFDTNFNAVTGLNGTGKSNILDSICFVLGITNLGHVRAASLQDLIYKSGQAGVNKATVTITFDNRNPEQSPPGFENYEEIVITRQVVMGGKNKYWINGSIVQNKKVQDLFCSVQLNVNNPHFLIMQGRVTKVLNMKPHEILGMIEEAAGTRMYETKRISAQKTIEKKDAKLAELNAIFKEEISPKLEKLKEERQNYLRFLRIERELEHMKALHQAWIYYAIQRVASRAEEQLEQAMEQKGNMEINIKNNENSAAQISNEICRLTEEAEVASGGKLAQLETELKSKETQNAKRTAAIKAAKESVDKEEFNLKQLEKNRKDDEGALNTKESELAKVQELFQKLKDDDEKDNNEFLLSQRKFETVSAGMEVNDDGEAQTLHEQLLHAKQEAAKADTEMKRAKMEVAHVQNELKEKEKQLGGSSSEYNSDKATVTRMEKEIKVLETSLAKMEYSEDLMNDLNQRKRILGAEVRTLKEKVDNFQSRRPHSKFTYSDPTPNFRRDKVYGVVCNLFQVNDPKYCTALETAAGGKLYNVIVEDDQTSTLLLQRGQLQTRKTFIPLNKIRGSTLNRGVVQYAEELVGADNVQPALSLISYDSRLKKAMEFVFGNVFICTDLNVARRVTFNDRILTKCVTLDGDVTDPGGILAGGASQRGTPVLLQIRETLEYEVALREKSEELAKIESKAGKMIQNQERYEQFKQSLDMKSHELGVIRSRMQQTTFHLQQQEVDQLREQINNLNRILVESKEIERKCKGTVDDLENKMQDMTGYRKRQLKAAEDEMKRAKAKADRSRKEWQKREQEYETLNLEILELRKAIESVGQNIENSHRVIVELKAQHEEEEESSKSLKDEVAKLQALVKEEKTHISSRNSEISKMVKKKEELIAKNAELVLNIKKQDLEVKKLSDELKLAKAKETDATKKVRNLDEKILREAETMNDKSGHDLQNRISRDEDTRNKLSRTVNTKAQSMLEHEEKQYTALLKKQKIVENDKKKLLTLIADLDKKKREAIQLAYDQVRKDLGSIFGMLLPGSNATLKPPQGKTILQGLEVKVSLGGVWKESLTELSGGQRSLVALSLILAMLLFKPAPLYILDEVDAALDLSHTQNIGDMLRSHFKQSQFIIVSLKDGMFNNANVLYQTKFIDGMSTVTRTVNNRR